MLGFVPQPNLRKNRRIIIKIGISRSNRYQNRLHIDVENPYTWLREIENGHFRDDRP